MSKQIEFTGRHVVSSEHFGVNFQAIVDGENMVCMVEIQALQDIDPSNAQGDATQQFLTNQSTFESIAEQKIRHEEIINGRVIITLNDIRQCIG